MQRHLGKFDLRIVGKDTKQDLAEFSSTLDRTSLDPSDAMPNLPKPPDTVVEFVTRFPDLGRAWEAARQAERAGPLDEKACRMVKPR